VFGLQGLAGEVGGCGASKGRLNKGSSGTLGYTKGSPDEHDNIDTKEAGCTFSVAPDTSLKGFDRSKNKSTVTEQIPRESLVAGSGAIILHPGMGTGDDLTAMALVPLRQKITQALDIGKRRVRRPFSVTEVEALVHSVEKLGTGR
jgi:protein TIF31